MIEVIDLIYYIIGIVVAFFVFFVSTYRIVPPTEAHFITSPRGTKVCSADEKVGGKKYYFFIPILMTVRKLDVTIQELVVSQETYEINQARYNVKSSVKYRIQDIVTAANRFVNNTVLQEQLQEVIRASLRAITVKYDVVDARALKQKMSEEISAEITDDLNKWGLELINFQMIDFQDTEDSHIISNISRRREKEIEAKTREEVAEKEKIAKMKEAESDEKAKEREIQRDKIVGVRQQEKLKKIAEEQKLAKQKEYEVIEVETVRQAEIDKAKVIVEANQAKERETIIKQQKLLEGQGDRLMQEEQAKGTAAPIREKGYAEALAKEKLQAALNKFEDKAIRALVAEAIVNMQKEVGIKAAEALARADLRIFAGGSASQQGFDLGELISSISTANKQGALAVLNKIARPNDLGLSELDLKKLLDPQKRKQKHEQPKKQQQSKQA